jgi:hypothetical protein
MAADVYTRLLNIVRMVGSDQSGERAAAANALYRVLRSNGITIHQFAEAVERGLRYDPANDPTVLKIASDAFQHGQNQGYHRGFQEGYEEGEKSKRPAAHRSALPLNAAHLLATPRPATPAASRFAPRLGASPRNAPPRSAAPRYPSLRYASPLDSARLYSTQRNVWGL